MSSSLRPYGSPCAGPALRCLRLPVSGCTGTQFPRPLHPHLHLTLHPGLCTTPASLHMHPSLCTAPWPLPGHPGLPAPWPLHLHPGLSPITSACPPVPGLSTRTSASPPTSRPLPRHPSLSTGTAVSPCTPASAPAPPASPPASYPPGPCRAQTSHLVFPSASPLGHYSVFSLLLCLPRTRSRAGASGKPRPKQNHVSSFNTENLI